MTNFESAHDTNKPPNKAVDFFLTKSGDFDKARSKDSIWNFHVWNEAWIGQWHAVDATPQERSDTFYQLGPAPLSAIKANSGGDYDVDFVVAEVDADVKYWQPDQFGVDKLLQVKGDKVGFSITTKQKGARAGTDITSTYKTPDRRRALQDETLDVSIDVPGEVTAPNEISWLVTVMNTGVSMELVRILISPAVISYNGTEIMALDNTEEIRVLNPGETLALPYEIPSEVYSLYTGYTNAFRGIFIVQAERSGDGVFGPGDVVSVDYAVSTVLFPQPFVSVDSSGPIPVGASGIVTLDYENLLNYPVYNISVVLVGGAGITFDGDLELTIDLGTLEPGDIISLSETFEARQEGNHRISASVFGDGLMYVEAEALAEVINDSNGNGVSDDMDISSGSSSDCNGNNIPDECEADCNSNGIPDDCDIETNASLDCDANGKIDICEIESGEALDDNSNGILDACETDCNNNGIPDDLDILRGTSSDFNGNGIPDVCDEDCNGNNIADEIEIADGSALDENNNGVPDECEVMLRSEPPSTSPSNAPTNSQMPSASPTTVPTTMSPTVAPTANNIFRNMSMSMKQMKSKKAMMMMKKRKDKKKKAKRKKKGMKKKKSGKKSQAEK